MESIIVFAAKQIFLAFPVFFVMFVMRGQKLLWRLLVAAGIGVGVYNLWGMAIMGTVKALDSGLPLEFYMAAAAHALIACLIYLGLERVMR